MKKLMVAENRADAERIRWYLESQGVEAWVDEEDPEDHKVWLISHELLEKAHKLAAMALKGEHEREVSEAIREVKRQTKLDKKASKRQESSQKSVRASGSFLQSPITYCLMVISGTIFLFNELDKNQVIYGVLRFSGNPYSQYWAFKNFDEIASGQIWRLITPAFLHFGWFHIIFNSLWCLQLGRLCESLMSGKKHLFMLLTIALLSHTGFYLVSGPSFGGLSGIIYGYVGYLWGLERFGNVRTGLEERTSQFFFVWFCICLALSMTGFMAIANTIHGLGALTGILFALFSTGAVGQIFKRFRFNRGFAKEAGAGFLLLIAGILVDHFF